MRELAGKLLRMDRRVIFVLIALATLIPLLRPIGFPIRISPEVKRIYDHIESLPAGSVFLLSLDFDPASNRNSIRWLWRCSTTPSSETFGSSG